MRKMETNKEIIFYCSKCHYKKITKSIADYKEHNVSSVPILYDTLTKKVNNKTRRKQFKCPSCGYVIIPKFINEGQNEQENNPVGN